MNACASKHPELKLGTGVLIGGRCSSPGPADDFVGLDWSMARTKFLHPWNHGDGIAFMFPITDGQPPKDSDEYLRLVDWIAERLEAGRRVHVGCIGGHGRTGLVIVGVVRKMLGHEDAIQWVRDNYCKKAVETKSQVAFLVEHCRVKTAAPSRSIGTGYSKRFGSGGARGKGPWQSRELGISRTLPKPSTGWKTRKPIKTHGSIWVDKR